MFSCSLKRRVRNSTQVLRHMAQTVGSFDLGLPEVEEEERAEQLLVMVEEEQNDNKGLLLEEFEDLSSFVMEEDPDMYAAAVESFMLCAILVKYSFKNHEFIVAFSWCIVH
jgi:hypothetical protein